MTRPLRAGARRRSTGGQRPLLVDNSGGALPKAGAHLYVTGMDTLDRIKAYKLEEIAARKAALPSMALVHPLKGRPTASGAIHAVFGTDAPCVITHPSDLLPILVAFDAVDHVAGPNGPRQIAARKRR